MYKEAYEIYFATLDEIEAHLANSKFLCGDVFTEADLRLFPTMYRHDPIYHSRMKLNYKFISDYPNLWRWLSDVYTFPGVAEASPLDHMKQGYFGRTGNSTVPLANGDDYLERLRDRNFGLRQAHGRELAESASKGASPEELVALAQKLAQASQ